MSRAVIQPFEEYQRARVIFVQTVAALAGGKDNRNVELLKRLDAIRLLGPLLTDPLISIKQYAAGTLDLFPEGRNLSNENIETLDGLSGVSIII